MGACLWQHTHTHMCMHLTKTNLSIRVCPSLSPSLPPTHTPQPGLGLAAVGLLRNASSLLHSLFEDMASPEAHPSSLLLVTAPAAPLLAPAIQLLDQSGSGAVTAERFVEACGGEIRAVLMGTEKCYLTLAAAAPERSEDEGVVGPLWLSGGDGQEEEQPAASAGAAAAAGGTGTGARYLHKFTRRDADFKHDMGCVVRGGLGG